MADKKYTQIPDDVSTSDSPASKALEPTLVPVSRIHDEQIERTLIGESIELMEESGSTGLSLPSFGDFELLKEIARGGMGVVYLARDKRLGRVVAIKTILNGQFASPESRARFLAEASAAARLDHPGIVPVYEIGEVQGQPFFSMKYVSGGSLADHLPHYRTNLRAGVELMSKVCRAVHHAHERGVLHRDLKPANILIDEIGAPLVADLGLAKAVDSENNITRSGAVMGTPGYMSPEQASGGTDVTTAADVYALGAMVFELLTGQPPHKGRTVVETLMSVIHEDTPTARSVNPEADRQLELVCQKCLSHKVEDRYLSAKFLADDLENWLAGEPLSVSAPSMASVGVNWLKKNARAALGSAGVGIILGLLIGVMFALTSIDVERMETVYNEFPNERPVALSLYSWVNSVPRAWRNVSQFPLFSLIAATGMVNYLVVRPKTRDVAIASGVLAGLFAAAMTFVTSLGWQPLASISVNEGAQDIEMLSRAAWAETESQRELARNAFHRRYPSLKNVDSTERPQMLASKVLFDQTMGIPVGLWIGLLLSVVVIGLPAMIGTALFGRLVDEVGMRWNAFGRYFECMPLLSVCIMLMLLYMFPKLAILPPVWARILVLSAMLATIWAAAKGVRWHLRILLHACWFAAFVLYVTQTNFITKAQSFAASAAAAGDYQRAVDLLEARLQQQPHSTIRFASAIGNLYLGNESEYLRHCGLMYSSYADDILEPTSAERLAKVILLRPDLHADVQQAYELADLAVEWEDHTAHVWFMACKALAELRRGNYQQASMWTDRVTEKADTQWQARIARTIASMAAFHSGQRDKAAELLDQASNGWDIEARAMEDGAEGDWMNRLFFEILLREATQLISARDSAKQDAGLPESTE
ncbi:MAG: serine/threonine protein kinase [Planctomyces sp.]|nr:serine/threonine protein kinase [Planctomyces sp.]